MKVNENLRDAIFQVIDNQINDNNPAETALTLKRLKVYKKSKKPAQRTSWNINCFLYRLPFLTTSLTRNDATQENFLKSSDVVYFIRVQISIVNK